jgi:hypothetical protein
MVFGILSLINMQKLQKKRIFSSPAMRICYILTVRLFLSNVFASKQPASKVRTMGSMAVYPDQRSSKQFSL